MKQTAVEWLINELEKHYVKVDLKNTTVFLQAKEIEKEQQGYSEEDLFKILLDFVAFPHDYMEPRGSIIERYLKGLKKK
jgi:hypothetical protein